MDYLISLDGIWKLAKNELIKSGWRRVTRPPDNLKDILGENSSRVYIIKDCTNCGSQLYLNSFVESGKKHCSCGKPFFEKDFLKELEKMLKPFKKKEISDINWTFGSYNQSETAES